MKHLLAVLLMLCLVIQIAAAQELELGAMDSKIMLHYQSETRIGDVHPFYVPAEDVWYVYYLKPDTFDAALAVTRDFLRWDDVEITGNQKLANYFVLGVIRDGNRYRSWYGSSISMVSSVSDDLINWTGGGSGYDIPMGYRSFPGGVRDPYVFYDEDAGVYRMVCTAYETNQLKGLGLGMKAAIATSHTTDGDLTTWTPIDTALIHYDGFHGEPECSQAMKIGDRWYLFTSLARRTENHVGRLSYYIGDAGVGFLQQNWEEKQEHFLTGEDLCAAQVAKSDRGVYLFGWITNTWNGGMWGGRVGFPLLVTQDSDGVLYTQIAPELSEVLRGTGMADFSKNVAYGPFVRYDTECSFQLNDGERFRLSADHYAIALDSSTGTFSIESSKGDIVHVSFVIPNLAGEHTLRVIAEGDIVEVFLDNQWSLCARIQGTVVTETLTAVYQSEVNGTVYALYAPDVQ